jgi:predicted DsbA family dithiol-disulfide isomerase
MRIVIYGDFNCPYSCLASARADALVEAGAAEVDWRAVEHDPEIPRPSEPVEGELADMLDREVAEVRSMLQPGETFPIQRPPIHPNSAAATAAFAAASPAEAHQLRRELFEALWFDGRDIGQPSLIRATGGDGDADGEGRRAAWQGEWEGLERRVVPMLVLPDGYVSRGLGALARLADLAS